MARDVTGDLASRTLVAGIASACLHTPPLYRSSTGLLLPLKRSMDLLRGEFSCCSPHFLVRYFPMFRAGASNPGDGNVIVPSTVAVREGSIVPTQSLAASPRPRHSGPSLAGHHVSLLLTWTGVLLNVDGGGGSLPYHSFAVNAIYRC